MSDKWNSILDDIKNITEKDVKILPIDLDIKNEIIEKFDINENSVLGAVIINSGGITIDNWIRIYGAGRANFCKRNEEFPYPNIVVAEDIIGGLFAYMDNGKLGYFAPDTLGWEELDITYSQFIYWALHGDTDSFYKSHRWTDWKKDAKETSIDKGISFYPYLWAKANTALGRTRKRISMREIIALELDFANQLNG